MTSEQPDADDWHEQRDALHRDHYEQLDALWTELGYAWNMVDDAALSDDIGDLNDKFLEEGHYALTKASFEVKTTEGVATFADRAQSIYRTALRRTMEVWKKAAAERMNLLKRELDKTLANVALNTDQEWQQWDVASPAYLQGQQAENEARDLDAKSSYRKAAETANSALRQLTSNRSRTSRRRKWTLAWQVLLLGVGIAGAASLVINFI